MWLQLKKQVEERDNNSYMGDLKLLPLQDRLITIHYMK